MTPITESELVQLGFYDCTIGLWGYKKENRNYFNLLWLDEPDAGFEAGVYIFSRLGYMKVVSMEEIRTILSVVFWNGEGK